MVVQQRWFTVPDRTSAGNTLRLFSRYWRPERPVRAEIFGIHGVCEHCGRYQHLAEDLTRAGYSLRMIDLRGHGQSGGPRAYVERFDHFLDDVSDVLETLQNEEDWRPDFLFGHSMGAAIMGLFGAERRPEVRGVILSGLPVVVGGRLMPILRTAAIWLSRRFPRLRLVKMNTPVLMQFGARYLTHDPKVIEDFRRDPLVYRGRLSMRLAGELLQATRRLHTAAERFELPLLLLHGTGDVLARSRGSELFYRRAASSDKTLQLYPDFYHEVINELDRDRVVADLLAWLAARSNPTGP